MASLNAGKGMDIGESAFYDGKDLFLVEIIGKQQFWLLTT
jgi:hypothetical protein